MDHCLPVFAFVSSVLGLCSKILHSDAFLLCFLRVLWFLYDHHGEGSGEQKSVIHGEVSLKIDDLHEGPTHSTVSLQLYWLAAMWGTTVRSK